MVKHQACESFILEFLEEIWTSKYALLDAEENTSEPLSKKGITTALSLLITLSAIH